MQVVTKFQNLEAHERIYSIWNYLAAHRRIRGSACTLRTLILRRIEQYSLFKYSFGFLIILGVFHA